MFTLTVGQKSKSTGGKKGAKLFLVDLAGSEKVSNVQRSSRLLRPCIHCVNIRSAKLVPRDLPWSRLNTSIRAFRLLGMSSMPWQPRAKSISLTATLSSLVCSATPWVATVKRASSSPARLPHLTTKKLCPRSGSTFILDFHVRVNLKNIFTQFWNTRESH